MVNSVLKIDKFRGELVRSMRNPETRDLLTDDEMFWRNGTMARELINEYKTFADCKMRGLIEDGLQHAGAQGVVVNPLVELEDVVTHCVGGGDISEGFLLVTFTSSQQTERMLFIKVILDDVNQCVSKYLRT